jgi:hypothetical protein
MATLVTKTESTVEKLAALVQQSGRGLFISKETRDAVAAITGGRKSSVRNQQLHPEYIVDFVGSYYTGFGNTDYQRSWSTLYELEGVR